MQERIRREVKTEKMIRVIFWLVLLSLLVLSAWREGDPGVLFLGMANKGVMSIR